MKLSSITNYSINNPTTYIHNKNINCSPKQFYNSTKYNQAFKAMPVAYSKVELSEEMHINDILYRKKLLSNLGLNPAEYTKIRSILGGQEIRKLLKTLSDKAEHFSVGKNFENINNGQFVANFHLHTRNSDGLFTTQELLDSAAEYGNRLVKKTQKPFIFAITDHDTTEGLEQATKIIAANPQKYKNIRIILGAEITTFDNIATDMVSFPTNSHLLVYGINPQEERFKKFIDETKQQKFYIAKKMIADANKIFQDTYGLKDFYAIDEAKLFSTQLREGVTGMYNHVDKYTKTKFLLYKIFREYPEIQNIAPKNKDDILQQLIKYYSPINNNNYAQVPHEIIKTFLINNANIDELTASNIIKEELSDMTTKFFYKFLDDAFQQYKITLNPKYKYVPTYKMVYDALENQPDALIGIAHPLDNASKLENSQKNVFMEKLYKKFKEDCKEKALFCETYYQSYSKDTKNFNEKPEIKIFMKQLAEKYNLFNTGGIDNHRKNLFERY